MFEKLRFMFELEERVTVMEGAHMCITNQLNIFNTKNLHNSDEQEVSATSHCSGQ